MIPTKADAALVVVEAARNRIGQAKRRKRVHAPQCERRLEEALAFYDQVCAEWSGKE